MSSYVRPLLLRYNHGMKNGTKQEIKNKCNQHFKGTEDNIRSFLCDTIDRIVNQEGNNARYTASVYINDDLYLELVMEGGWWNYFFGSKKRIEIKKGIPVYKPIVEKSNFINNAFTAAKTICTIVDVGITIGEFCSNKDDQTSDLEIKIDPLEEKCESDIFSTCCSTAKTASSYFNTALKIVKMFQFGYKIYKLMG